MNEEEQIIEILENIEVIQKKTDKLIAKLFLVVRYLIQMTLQEFLRIKYKRPFHKRNKDKGFR